MRSAKSGLFTGAAVAALLLFVARRASAKADYMDYVLYPTEAPMGVADSPSDSFPVFNDYDWTAVDGMPIADYTGTYMKSEVENLDSFRYLLRSTEHRFPDDVVNDAAYHIFYGGSTFSDMSDHPVNTGEKKGVPLPDRYCLAAGLSPGCVSTAAGAYQIIRPTWNRVRVAGKYGERIPAFDDEGQDEAARRILADIGALPYVLRGDIETAIAKASKTWASLPGSTAKQGGKSLAFALARFNEYGVA